MSLIQRLPSGPLDIVGDIHGEIAALRQLLTHLGYDEQGHHPQGRRLVFVGDFCDRGPDSPAVLRLVLSMIAAGTALAVLGNHEINLLRNDPKDGSGWFFDARLQSDLRKYPCFARPHDPAERSAIVHFLRDLPVALEREDLIGYAAELGLDVDRFIADLDSPAVIERVERDLASAVASGAHATPTFFVEGRRLRGSYDARTLTAALEASRRGTRTQEVPS